jgi:4a-hydroxytetrahydrobiopterin dehydratase
MEVPASKPSLEKSMPALSEEQAASRLKALPEWEITSGELVRTFKFEDFRASLRFVNKVAELAEAAGHHPDIDIRYNKVRLALVTHDAGGLTSKDFDLAALADMAV